MKCRADFNLSVTVKNPWLLSLPVRFLIQFSGSLCFFSFFFFLLLLQNQLAFEKLKDVFILCISLSLEANKCCCNKKRLWSWLEGRLEGRRGALISRWLWICSAEGPILCVLSNKNLPPAWFNHNRLSFISSPEISSMWCRKELWYLYQPPASITFSRKLKIKLFFFFFFLR